MRSGLRGRVLTALAASVGAAVAVTYAHFVGCRTGTCPITSSAWNAALYGALVGTVVGWPNRPRDRGALPREAQGPHPSQEGAGIPPQS